MKYYIDFKEKDVIIYKDRKGLYRSDNILTFDIEVSSGWIENGVVIGYRKYMNDEYWNNLEPVSLCYIWQFSYDNEVYYGREIEDFLKILNMLRKDIKYIIYVHNLAYEFQFMLNILQPFSTVFARNAHKPMKVVSELYPNIEFRCSYMLTRLSLDSWGKTLNFQKLHSLDYDELRTPKSKLQPKELEYCERDCLVVYEGIKKYRERYGHIHQIPLTQTGEVRKVVKKKMLKRKGWQNKVTHLLPYNAKEYEILFRTFTGGYTHANYSLAGRVHKNVSCYDFASSYPYVMISEKFPMTSFFPKSFNIGNIEEYAHIIKVRYNSIDSKKFNTYISYSKSFDVKNPVLDNGRIMSADTLSMWITEQDYLIIEQCYNYESVEILDSYASKKAYLPKEFLEYILELYENKTTLKDVDGMQDIYAQSKQFINSLFGMCVTALVPEDVTFTHNEWVNNVKSVDDINEYLKDLRENPKGRVFLNYAWGVWITAYARHNLWKCMLSLDKDNVNDVIYVDTDSIKARGLNHNFDWYNEEVVYKLKKSCKENGLDFEKTRPKNPKGKVCQLGFFEREDDCKEFITLGAKRYCYRSAKDGELHITIAGVNKSAVECLHNDITNFKDGVIFDKDEECVTPKLLHYLSEQPKCVWNKGKQDEYTSNYRYGINMRNRGYELSITELYNTLINLDSNEQSIFT